MGKKFKVSGGFTLIELMVVVAIAAILVSQAVPSLTATVRSIQLSTATSTFFSSLILTRSEAIKRNSRAVLCKSFAGIACSSSGGWEQGWIVFHDLNNNVTVDAGEVILLRQEALQLPMRLNGNEHVANYISYTATGTTQMVSGAFQAGTLTVCSESSTRVYARQIVISSMGRPRSVKTEVQHCP
ncbi:MAG: GspH/FimT family pseudopilin [Rhodoferax sp.]|nr:GspH/FimT family pseudopilin [Rhodoferax sp.]